MNTTDWIFAAQVALECAKRILERDPHVTDTARRPIDDQAACVARYLLAAAPPVAADAKQSLLTRLAEALRHVNSCAQCARFGVGQCEAGQRGLTALDEYDAAPPVAADQLELAKRAIARQATLTEKEIIEGGVNFILGGPGEAVAADIAEGREVLARMTPGEWEGPEDIYAHVTSQNYLDNRIGIAYLRNKASAWLDELARLRAAVPDDVRAAAKEIIAGNSSDPIPKYQARQCARYIASIAEPAAGKQLVDIHYNPTTIHDGPP